MPLVVAAIVATVLAALAPGAERTATVGPRAVVTNLASPVGLAAPRNEPGRLYVVEQGGTIRVVVKGKLRPEPFLDVRNLVRAGGEQGLLGLAFHPRYVTTKRFYVNYTDRNGNTNVVEYRSNGAGAIPGSARRVLFVAQPYSNHNGGGVAFGPDGKLYVGTGDGGSGGDPENRAQNLSSQLGKMIRIDVDKRGSKPQIVALGLRNPWRYSFDRQTGDLTIADVGQNALEEINHTPRGTTGLLNYGWDVYEGRAKFEDKTIGAGKLRFPVIQYGRGDGCSVTGGLVYRGKGAKAAFGRYFYGDFCTGNIWSAKLSGRGATGLRKERFKIASVTSFGEDAAGELFAVSHGGTLYRLTP